jgi:hypothetical protein
MRRGWCEREFDTVRAVRTGLMPAALREHVVSCAVCTEARAVAEKMMHAASLRSAELELPAAGLVWRRVEARRKEMALRRATRPLVFMRVLGAMYVVLSAGWVLRDLRHAKFMELPSSLAVFGGEAMFFTAAMAMLSMVIGAVYLLQDSRRSGGRVPSI